MKLGSLLNMGAILAAGALWVLVLALGPEKAKNSPSAAPLRAC
jgi:hypothetical protein